MFSPDQWAASTGVAFYNGVATQSLRYNDDDNPYLSKTFSAGNAKTWTWSGWVKLSSTTVSNSFIYSQLSSGSDVSWLYFTSNNQLNMQSYEGGNQLDIMTNAKFRDTSAWYHIMAVLDTTQSTSTDRAKMYVNGELQTSLANTTYPSQNADLKFNNGDAPVLIGGTPDGYGTGAGYKLDGYLAEVNFVDGQALTPTSFGEFKNGVWIAKEYTGSYGTNGFRLQFNQTGTGTPSSSTIGADTSGNANHFSSSGIVASDCDMPDSPENNFATWNGVSSFATDNSEGNLKASASSGNASSRTNSTIPISSGKWYFEVRLDDAGTNTTVGIAEQASPATYPGQLAGDYVQELDNARKGNNNSFTSYGTSLTTGDIFNCAVDLDNGEIYFGKNGTYFNSSDPATNTSPAFSSIPSGLYTIVTRPYSSATEAIIVSLNAGQDSSFAGNETAQGNTDANGIGDFYYAPPSGYLALCSANLPEPTISPNQTTQADDYFNTVIYSGNNDATRTFDVGFVSDFSWFKARSAAGYAHQLYDSVRGVQKRLRSNTSDAEATNSEGVLDFDDNGLLKIGTDAFLNESGTTMVIWNWKAGGTAVSNTDGSITSSVSANTDAGFSIVNYTGTGSSATVGHGLGKKPSLIFIKRRAESSNWAVAGSVLGSTATLYLNLTNAQETYSDPTVINTQTTTTFSIGTDTNRNKNTFEHIAYCFAEIEGFSKIGSYTGNGSTDGTFVYTGFRPAFVLVKRTNSAQDWTLFDSSRNPTNATNLYLHPNNNAADGSGIGDGIDLVSNGFKMRHQANVTNNSGSPYIYMAFAENPFKYANAR